MQYSIQQTKRHHVNQKEFVILSKHLEIDTFCRQMEKLNFSDAFEGFDFKGLSFGYASFPADGYKLNELLHLADLKMYEIKKQKA